jgi:hypothetical protein
MAESFRTVVQTDAASEATHVVVALTETVRAATAFTSAAEHLKEALAESAGTVPTSAFVTPIQDVTRAYVNLSKLPETWSGLAQIQIPQMQVAAQFEAITEHAASGLRRQLEDIQALIAAPWAVGRDITSLRAEVEGNVPDALLRANKIAFVAEETPVADKSDAD